MKILYLLSSLFLLFTVSCVSSPTAVAFNTEVKVYQDSIEFSLSSVNNGMEKVYKGYQYFTPTDDELNFASISLVVKNISGDLLEMPNNKNIELIILRPESSEPELISLALSLDEVDDYTEILSADFPANKQVTKKLAYLVPLNSKVLGVFYNRSLVLDIIDSTDLDYPEYQNFVEMTTQNNGVFNAITFLPFEVVKSLIDSIAFDINTEDENGLTIFHHALFAGNISAVQGLLEMGVDRNIETFFWNDQISPIHLAVLSGNVELVEWMVSHGFDIYDLTKEGRNSFSLAVKSGSVPMVQYLVSQGFNPEEERIEMAMNTTTPLIYSRINQFEDLVEYFLSLGLVE